MIDFIKINYSNTGYILPTSLIDFKSGFNLNTGEIEENITGNYYDFKIKRFGSGRTMITGSIHKFFNRHDFNGNDLTAMNFQKSVLDLRNEINLIPDECVLENVEIGVNVQTDFNPNLFLDNLLFHRTTEFNKPISGVHYMQSKKDNYIIKIYNKTAQNNRVLRGLERELKGNNITQKERTQKESLAQIIKDQLKDNTLRFEIKFLKMEVLNKMGIKTTADLCKREIFEQFKRLLLEEFNEVYFYDYTTEIHQMKPINQISFKDYRNPNFWKSLNRKDKYYHKKRFNQLTLEYSRDLKGKISKIISEKTDQLTAKSLDILTDILAPEKTVNFRQINHSYIGVKRPNITTENNRVCLVTGLNISMQKKTSKYLCSTGLIYYLENEPDIYKRLKDKYLTAEKRGSELRKQIYYIAHNIRNTKTNVEHNKRNNRQRFEQRNYPKHQLQFSFIP